MKIGFYGSSICHSYSSENSRRFDYKSYIQLLEEKYNAEIIHLGSPAIGTWDIIIRQYSELLTNIPDIAVFVWSGPGYLYTKEWNGIGAFSMSKNSKLHDTRPDLWPAVSQYYEKLYDLEKDRIEQVAAYTYFDNMISNDLHNKCKIIHTWEGDMIRLLETDLSNSSFVNNFSAPYVWKTGTQLDVELLSLSMCGQWPRRPTVQKIFSKDPRCNHLEGIEKNMMVYSWISYMIDNYQPGLRINKLSEVTDLYDRLLKSN